MKFYEVTIIATQKVTILTSALSIKQAIKNVISQYKKNDIQYTFCRAEEI